MITFVSADGMPLPSKRRWLRSWLVEVAARHEARIEHLSYAFGSSAWMANLNQQFLNHEGDTDILTFDYSENPEDGIIHGECCISPSMIREQAKVWGASFEDEMHRVLVHGLLHSLLQLKMVVLSTRSLIALVPCSWLSCSNSPMIFFWAAVWKINAK